MRCEIKSGFMEEYVLCAGVKIKRLGRRSRASANGRRRALMFEVVGCEPVTVQTVWNYGNADRSVDMPSRKQ